MQSLTTLETVDQLHAWAVDLTLDPPDDRRWRFSLMNSPGAWQLVPTVWKEGPCPPSMPLSRMLGSLLAPHWKVAATHGMRPARRPLDIVQIVSGSAGVRAVEAEIEAATQRRRHFNTLTYRLGRRSTLPWGWEHVQRTELGGESYRTVAIRSSEGLMRVRDLLALTLSAIEPWGERVRASMSEAVTALAEERTHQRAHWASERTRECLALHLLDEACLQVGRLLDAAHRVEDEHRRENWTWNVRNTLRSEWRDFESAYADYGLHPQSGSERFLSMTDRLVDVAMAEYAAAVESDVDP